MVAGRWSWSDDFLKISLDIFQDPRYTENMVDEEVSMELVYISLDWVTCVYYVGGGVPVSCWIVPGTLDLEA